MCRISYGDGGRRFVVLLAMGVALGFAPGNSRAAPARLTGYVDALDAQSAGGWACVPGSGSAVGVRAYAGTALVTVVTTNVTRQDVAAFCGDLVPHGFTLWFDQSARAAFAGAMTLSLFATATGFAPLLLPASRSLVHNPAPIPNGALSGLNPDGSAVGWVDSTSSAPPVVRLFAGAPGEQGGTPWGNVTVGAALAGRYSFTVRPGVANAGPLYAMAAQDGMTAVPLGDPLPSADPAAGVAVASLAGTAAQSGARSGITTTLFTRWVPAGMGIAGLSGMLTLSGNNTGFAEALVTVGTTADTESSCAAKNATWPVAEPTVARVWAGIVKANVAGGGASLPVNLALPAAMAGGAPAGICLMSVISAGYPYLDAEHARYTVTHSDLSAWLVPLQPNAPTVLALGIGGEFRFVTGTRPLPSTVVGIRAVQPLTIDGIAGVMSAAPVSGAPAGSPWLPPPAGAWTIASGFYALQAADCTATGLAAQRPNGTFAVIRAATPGPFTMPAGAVQVMATPAASVASLAIQRSLFASFALPGPGLRSRLTLQAGDCLLSVHTLLSAPAMLHGAIDLEDQSTVYLRVSP